MLIGQDSERAVEIIKFAGSVESLFIQCRVIDYND
jgi:hypothetical protein